MILAKGVELIPKRDKVTIASNILGKWEDYSVDTYQGKILKEAAERYKVMLKEGKEAAVAAEVPQLKEKLLHPQESKKVDFWNVPKTESIPVPVVAAEEPKVVIPKVSTPVAEVKNSNTINVIDNVSDDSVVVVHAYKRRDRQVYLSGWDDTNDWMLSVVPYPMTATRARKLIKKAIAQIKDANEKATIRSRFPSDLEFELVPWVDTAKNELTENEIRKQAEEMIRLHRESRGKK